MALSYIRDRIKGFQRIKAKDLLPNDRNWRIHPPEQKSALKGILNEIGFAGAILVRPVDDGKYQIIDGHLRAKTAPNMDVPVLVTDLSAEEADKLLLTYDPISAMALADKARIDALLASVRFEDKALGPLFEHIAGQEGWQPIAGKTLIDPPARIDKAAELRAKWGTAPGQAWQIGPHRLICGDCRENATVGRLWRDGGPKIRMVWTDPPYGIDYVASKDAALSKLHKGLSVKKSISNDSMSAVETMALFTTALSIATSQAEKGAAVYATVPGGPLLPKFIAALEESGFTYRWCLVWVKQHFVLGQADYHFRHEPILYGWIEDGPHYFAEDRTQDSVFQVAKPQVSELHPTTKPVELIARMVTNSSRPGELVYDPFCGSGSTLLAAHQLGRIGFGVEIDPGYVAVVLERLAVLGLKPILA